MKITKLTAQQKNQDRVNVFIDGKYELSLSLDELLEQKLRVGKELDAQDLKILKKVSEDGKIKGRTLEWLLSRPRSRQELKEYLYKKKLEKAQIESFCEYFSAKGYQNDETFTKWWIDQRARKNKSSLSIKTELRQKGIAPEIIVNNLQQEFNDQEQIKNLIINKNLNKKYPDRQKLMQYLAGKGFGYSDIVDVLDGLNDDADNF